MRCQSLSVIVSFGSPPLRDAIWIFGVTRAMTTATHRRWMVSAGRAGRRWCVSGDGERPRPRALAKLSINYLMDEGLMKAGCEVVVAGYDAPPNGRYWGNNGQKWILGRAGLSAFDPVSYTHLTLPTILRV